ncbi:MAG: DUF2079 domain-containing protein [Thermomicrobiales bacterium]
MADRASRAAVAPSSLAMASHTRTPHSLPTSLEALATRWAAPLLAALIVLYTTIFTGLNIYRTRALRQGFDFLVYEQPIWNTVHGRPFAQSMYAFAPTHLGVDLVWFELWIAPFYALWQSPVTLFVLISLGAALATIPLYLIARERLSSAALGLLCAALYLVYLPVGTITLDEFQPRLFSASALLAAWWCAHRRRPIAYWCWLLVALSVRSDVGLVVGCLGLYELVRSRAHPEGTRQSGSEERANPQSPPTSGYPVHNPQLVYGLAPAIVGFGYWALAIFVLAPYFAAGHSFLFAVNYAWLGDSTRAIVTTVVTHPLYTLQGVLTLEKARYLAQLLWPLAFLPVLRLDIVAIAAPIFALNLLSGEEVQFDVLHQYQALIIPFLFLATIAGLADLRDAGARGRRWRLLALGAAAALAIIALLPVWPGNADSRNGLHATVALVILAALIAVPVGIAFLAWRRDARLPLATLAAVLLLMALQYPALGSEVIRFAKNPHASPRLPAAQQIIARVPPDAPLAVTSQLGLQVPLRQQLYAFPGNSSYDPALVARAQFVIGDRQRDFPREREAIDQLIATGDWRVVAEENDYVLLERK